jgi:hypothetical protein
MEYLKNSEARLQLLFAEDSGGNAGILLALDEAAGTKPNELVFTMQAGFLPLFL